MTKNSDSQVSASRDPTRERVGLLVDGIKVSVRSKRLLEQKLLEYAKYG